MRSFAEQQVHARLNRVRDELERARANPDEDAIHDLRVSIRRLSQALRILAHLLGPTIARQLRASLRPLLKAAGEVRNCDIGISILRRSRLPDVDPIIHHLRAQRAATLQAFTQLLHANPLPQAAPQWRPQPKPGRWNPAASPAANAAAVLPALSRKFFKAGAAAARPETSWAELHQFRLRGKRYRYTLELFLPVYGPGLERRLDTLRRVQTVLGDINDYETLLAMPAVQSSPSVVAWLEHRRRQKRRKFDQLWTEEFAPERQKRWIQYLKRYAR
jgi:CHAD domain-containing protein